MKLIVMRHGEDLPGYRGGWSKYGLTDVGKKQVFATAIQLKNLDFEYIISSDLVRAKETATLVSNICNKKLIFDSDVREINNGDLSGMDNKIADKMYPGVYYNTLGYEESYPNGESPSMFFNRVYRFYQKIIKEKDSILIVTHGGVINVLYCIHKNIPHTNSYNVVTLGHGEILVLD